MAEAQDTTARLREQRDRFVAFAFAGADMMVEVMPDGIVTYAAGVCEAICGLPGDLLVGKTLADYVSPVERYTLAEALRRIATGGRFDSLSVSFRPESGPPVTTLISGIHLGGGPCTHLAIIRLRGAALAAARDPGPPPGQRIDPEDFVTMVEKRLKEGDENGEEYSLTLLDVSDAKGMTPVQASDFFANVEGFLRAHSVGGTSVGRLCDDKFGVVSEGSLDPDQIAQRISDIAQVIDPDGPPPAVHAQTVNMEDAELSAQDLTRALVYTINKFAADGGEKMSISSLAEGCRAAMGDTLNRVAHFREVINSDSLSFVFQPIIELHDWSVHHFEALARIRQNNQTYLPSSFITFAEDVGVVSDLDMEVCRRAISELRRNVNVGPDARVAINLSGRTISGGIFMERLFRMLRDNADLLPRILFEITESSEMRNLDEANRMICKLRDMGCEICLDDFGAGAAAFQYLRALTVDFVKIDGSYIMDAFDTHYGLPFLKAMATLCADMGMAAIAEMVEDERALALVRQVGIEYAQGYYFCRPRASVADFLVPPRTVKTG